MGIIEHGDGRLEFVDARVKRALEYKAEISKLKAGAPIPIPKRGARELNEWHCGSLIRRGYVIEEIVPIDSIKDARERYSRFGNNVKFLVGAYQDPDEFRDDLRIVLRKLF